MHKHYEVKKSVYKFKKPPLGTFDSDFLKENLELLAEEGQTVLFLAKAGRKSVSVKLSSGKTVVLPKNALEEKT
jgi:hypothetical protein